MQKNIEFQAKHYFRVFAEAALLSILFVLIFNHYHLVGWNLPTQQLFDIIVLYIFLLRISTAGNFLFLSMVIQKGPSTSGFIVHIH